MDKRHFRRQRIVQQLFASMFEGMTDDDRDEKTQKVIDATQEIDPHIKEYAKKYDIDKVAKVDLSILRLATYELLMEDEVPPKVVINEAVELAKEMGGDKSPGFINAVLGKIYEASDKYEENPDDEKETDDTK